MIRNYPKPPYKSAPEFMFGNPRNGEGVAMAGEGVEGAS
jgi:hypothetical protein